MHTLDGLLITDMQTVRRTRDERIGLPWSSTYIQGVYLLLRRIASYVVQRNGVGGLMSNYE